MSGNEAKSIMQHFEGLPPLQEGGYSNYGDVEVKALPRAQYFGILSCPSFLSFV